MHAKNRYAEKHDFRALARFEPELNDFLITTPGGKLSLDFSESRAVYLLNRTLLRRDYGLLHWDIPAGNLTPPVPGRLDYIHTLAELAPGTKRVLDIGCGASLIYPILGNREYGWTFVGTDIDPRSIAVARAIIKHNGLRGITVRRQTAPQHIFTGIVQEAERFDLTMCNPPFFASREDAAASAEKKWHKLGRKSNGRSFGGTDGELHTDGGEASFLRTMIEESGHLGSRVGWFTTLVSKAGYLRSAVRQLERVGAGEVRVLRMEQGNKRSRILAWRY